MPAPTKAINLDETDSSHGLNVEEALKISPFPF